MRLNADEIARVAYAVRAEHAVWSAPPILAWDKLTAAERDWWATAAHRVIQGEIQDAEGLHDFLREPMVADGWTPGLEYDPFTKTSPDVCAFGNLDMEQQTGVRLVLACIKELAK